MDLPVPRQPLIRYSDSLEKAITEIQTLIEKNPDLAGRFNPRWLAVKLLERDAHLLKTLRNDPGAAEVIEYADQTASRLGASETEDIEVLVVDARYTWINQLTRDAVKRQVGQLTTSERIDRIVTHRVLGIPIFLGVMFILFRMVSEVPAPAVDWLDAIISGPLTRWIDALIHFAGLSGTWVERMLVLGVLPGVGGVLAFVPVLMALYLGLGLLEDSGYMARAAFVIDRLMHALGLHGKSSLPMIIGFGCSVPGIYATRTMENQRERVLTGLLVPFMSCGARLPVYALLTSIFFPRQAGVIIFGLYLTGIIIAVLIGLLLNRTLFRSMPPSAFLMELPAYHRPVWKNIWRQTWERTSGFIKKAGTTILSCAMIIWVLMSIPVRGSGSFANTPVQDSAFAVVSQAAAPIFAPLGFDNWQMSGSLLTGIVAKEVVVSTLSQAYASETQTIELATSTLGQDLLEIGQGFIQTAGDTLRTLPLLIGIDLRGPAEEEMLDGSLNTAIQNGFAASSEGATRPAVLAFLVFILLYTPCISALIVERQELGTKWMVLTIFGQFGIAWLIGMLIFQIGRLWVGG